MKITIEIPDDFYGDYMDEDDNLVINPPPGGDSSKSEKLWTGHLMNGNVSDLRWLV